MTPLNVITLTDEAQAVRRQYGYDDWGNSGGTSGTLALPDADRARWKGALWMGPELDLYYMRNRWYEPGTGRFLSEDPTGLRAGINPVVFERGNPANGRDPTGLGQGGPYIGDGVQCTDCNAYIPDGWLDITLTLTTDEVAVIDWNGGGGAAAPGPCKKALRGPSAIPSGAGTISFSDAEVTARRIANEELARTQRITDNYRLGGHNDIYDAERHARWVYRMSVAIGSGWAGMFATAHEFQEALGQPFIEMRMDLNNNSIGMNAAIDGTGMPTRSTPGLTYIRDNRLVRRGC